MTRTAGEVESQVCVPEREKQEFFPQRPGMDSQRSATQTCDPAYIWGYMPLGRHTYPQYYPHRTSVKEEWGRDWWPGRELNPRHADFQSAALPTELPGQCEPRIRHSPGRIVNYGLRINALRCGCDTARRIAVPDEPAAHDTQTSFLWPFGRRAGLQI
jgi:hypothetical protein